MAQTQARIGHGSQFYVGSDDSPITWTAIAEITSITPPSVTRDIIDATHTGSADQWREHIPGLKDGGEVSCEMNFVPNSDSANILIAIQVDSFARDFKIAFPDATEWIFTAFCTGFEPDAPFDDKMTATATFKVSGKPDFVTVAETAADGLGVL
jgi:predicted secreted protein